MVKVVNKMSFSVDGAVTNVSLIVGGVVTVESLHVDGVVTSFLIFIPCHFHCFSNSHHMVSHYRC